MDTFTPQQEQRMREIYREEFSAILKSDRFVFDKLLQIADSNDIQLGRTTGTKIGTDVDQKIGFYGKTPLVLQTGVAVTAAGVHAALVALGLITA